MQNELAQNNLKKSTPQDDSIFEISTFKRQSMDYFDKEGVSLRTGYTDKLLWYLLPIRELLDNACDFLQKNYKGSRDVTITVNIHMTDKLFHLTVRNSNMDNKPVFCNLSPIFNFDIRYGSKQDVHIISRGMLGDALKQILSLGYVLLHNNDDGNDWRDEQWPHPLIIRHNGHEIRVDLQVNNAKQEATAREHKPNKLTHIDTELELILPVIDEVRDKLTRSYVEEYCRKYSLLTTDISFNFIIIDDINHQDSQNNKSDMNIQEELNKALSTVPEKGKLKIEVPALHPISSDWKNGDSIHSYKPDEFKRRLLNVYDAKITVYDVLSKFREGASIQKTQYQMTVQELLNMTEDERNKIIEQYFIELNKISAPELSLPYPTKFNIAKGIRKKRHDVLIERIVKIRDDVDINRRISYKLVRGNVTDNNYLNYPFAFEIIAIPLRNPVGSSRSSHDVKQHEFIGMVNYSFSPKNNHFVGTYHNEDLGYDFESDIKGILRLHGFKDDGGNFHKLPCIIIGNLITPKWDPISHDKSGVNIKPFAKVIKSAVEKISKEIETYHAAGIHWSNVGSKHEGLDTSGYGRTRGRVSAKSLLEEFLIESGRL